jgi:hypothetical protein
MGRTFVDGFQERNSWAKLGRHQCPTATWVENRKFYFVSYLS